MIDFERGLYVRIVQMERGPHPHPLEHGFTVDKAYRILAIYNPSESGECWLVMSNTATSCGTSLSATFVRMHS